MRMFANNGPSAAEQLQQLCQANAQTYGSPASPPSSVPPTHVYAGLPRRRSWRNPWRWFEESSAEDRLGQELHTRTTADIVEAIVHGSQVQTQHAKFASDIRRVQLDDASRRRAEKSIRSAECWTAVETLDGIRAVAMRADDFVQQAEQDIKDEKIRETLQAVARDAVSLVRHRLWVNAYGFPHDPDNPLGRD
jgi:hypothetical protein